MEKTLYLTDLDGTLLNRESRLSPFTVQVLNGLIDRGICFSYATARSIYSASLVTEGLRPQVPVICFNGTFLCDPATKEILSAERFTEEQVEEIRRIIDRLGVDPMIFSLVDGAEKVTRMEGVERQNEGIRFYLENRPNDQRQRTAKTKAELYAGEIIHFSMIGDREAVAPAAEAFQEMSGIASVFFQELRRPEYWCELMPEKGQKSYGALKLKEMLGCNRIVAFGDAANDLPLFAVADECYAVENAVPALKAAATGIIPSNEEDGVAQWLLKHID